MTAPTIIFNWKMNPESIGSAYDLLQEYTKALKQSSLPSLVVCAPAVYLPRLVDYSSNLDVQIEFGGQNSSSESKGSFTGQISASMLADCGCIYTLVGHSETRQFCGVTEESIPKRIQFALSGGLNPIVCVGYAESRDQGSINYNLLKSQVVNALQGYIGRDLPSTIIIAYEPVWAIGTGVTASLELIESAHDFILNTVKSEFSDEIYQNTQVVYGGSVDDTNIQSILSISNVSGVLIGSASLHTDKATKMICSISVNN